MPTSPGTVVSRWIGGVNSLVPPDSIGVNQYAWSINSVNRGGIVQTRPGWDWKASIQGKKCQGSIVFTPTDSKPVMLVAVDGEIWFSKFPFTDGTFQVISNLSFRADAQFINFCSCLKQANVNQDGTISEVTPTQIVIIQDGASNAGWYDGVTAKTLTFGAPFNGAPIGLWMAFSGQRLWIANGSILYASDLASPDTFTETQYLAERSSFALPGDCTGLIETSDEQQLLVFTANTTLSFQSSILNRDQWQTTAGFETVALPNIGCVSGRSPVNQYGVTWWMSQSGFINLDEALNSKITSKVMTLDGPMMRSKRIMSPDRSGVCSGFYENYLLVSVPAGGKYNYETWAADQTPGGAGDGSANMAWVGIWTGVCPVQWMRVIYGGRERLYFVSFDQTPKDGTRVHAWEAFKSDRRDNDGRISCQMETGMFLGTDLERFDYAEIDVTEILGPVELKAFVGGSRGPWVQVADIVLQAEIGCLGSSLMPVITKTTILEGFKPQSRLCKTNTWSNQLSTAATVPCPVENKNGDAVGKDKGFQILLEWTGRAGIRSIKVVMKPDPAPQHGACSIDETGEINAINESGENFS